MYVYTILSLSLTNWIQPSHHITSLLVLVLVCELITIIFTFTSIMMIHRSILIFLLWLCGCKTMWWILYCKYTFNRWVVIMIICCFIKCIAIWIAFVPNICHTLNHKIIPSIYIIWTTLRDWGIRTISGAVTSTACSECVVVFTRARSTVGYAYTYTYTYFTLLHFTSLHIH